MHSDDAPPTPAQQPLKLAHLLEGDDRKTAFLAVLRETYTITAAARVFGVERSTVMRWRHADAAFDEAVKQVLEQEVPDLLESASIRYGLERPGNFLDRAMMLKAKRPDTYKDQVTVHHNVVISADLSSIRTLQDYHAQQMTPPLPAGTSPLEVAAAEVVQDAEYTALEVD